MTQVSLAIAALLKAWLSPRQLSAVSGRVNPNGLIRDARAEAARRGLVWREVWVRNEWGKRYKMHHLERSESLARPACPGGVPPSSNAAGSAAQGRGTGGDGAATPTEHPSPGPEKHSEMARRAASRSSSPSRWRNEVGVSGSARATGGAQGELWRERG